MFLCKDEGAGKFSYLHQSIPLITVFFNININKRQKKTKLSTLWVINNENYFFLVFQKTASIFKNQNTFSRKRAF